MKVPGYDPKGYAQAIKGADTREESERNGRGLDTDMASAVVIHAHSTANIRFAAKIDLAGPAKHNLVLNTENSES